MDVCGELVIFFSYMYYCYGYVSQVRGILCCSSDILLLFIYHYYCLCLYIGVRMMSHQEHHAPPGPEDQVEEEEGDMEARTAVEALLALTSPADYPHHSGRSGFF